MGHDLQIHQKKGQKSNDWTGWAGAKIEQVRLSTSLTHNTNIPLPCAHY